MKTSGLLFSLGVGGLNKYHAQNKCQDVESSGHIENVLVSCGIELGIYTVNVLGDELAGVVTMKVASWFPESPANAHAERVIPWIADMLPIP